MSAGVFSRTPSSMNVVNNNKSTNVQKYEFVKYVAKIQKNAILRIIFLKYMCQKTAFNSLF